MIKIGIQGIGSLKKKLENMKINTYSIIDNSLEEVIDEVQKEAMSILRQKIGTGIWGGTWSHGTYDQNDKISECWEQEKMGGNPSYIERILRNTSSHAAPVEFGSRTPIRPKGPYLWLGGNMLVKEVKGQRGYSFLNDAVHYNKDAWRGSLQRKFYKRMSAIR